MRKKQIVFAVIFIQFFSYVFPIKARADNMSIFLKSCAYGALAGAAVGLASLAISDNPGGKINNVARGASLGLYAGVGIGAYLINNPSRGSEIAGASKFEEIPYIWFSPVIKSRNIEGAEIHWTASTF